jgi:tetratricopeptide (TPR) repeat protein
MPVFLGGKSAVDQLSGLDDIYIKECLDLWLQESPQRAAILNDPNLADIIKLINGHPLAAKMVASYLKVKPMSQLLVPDESRRFQLKLADYVLRANDLQSLNDLHHLILVVLAAIKQPVTLTDLLAVRLIKERPLGDVQKALGELGDLFLVEHDGELLYLHRFLETYYADRASENPTRLQEIARDFGNYAYARAIESNEQLKPWYPEDAEATPRAIALSNEVFRYAISADRLLRSVGEKARAEDLPIQVRGTLREMVFYFYQQAHDYKTALAYAEQWLAFNATDLEIMLYKARCYRNLADAESLSIADATISRLEQSDHSGRFHERILREKGLVAQARGDYDKAKAYFLEGAQIHRAYAYPDNHVGVAQSATPRD